MSQPRRILLVVHPARPEVHDHALGVVRRLKAAGVPFMSEADEGTTGPASFVVVDPDGNPVLFDQHV